MSRVVTGMKIKVRTIHGSAHALRVRITKKLMGLDVHVRCQVEGISDAVTLAQNLNQLLCLSMNDEALVRWVLKRPRTLKPCKRNYLFEGSIGERQQVKGSICKSVKEQLVLDALGGTVPSPKA